MRRRLVVCHSISVVVLALETSLDLLPSSFGGEMILEATGASLRATSVGDVISLLDSPRQSLTYSPTDLKLEVLSEKKKP